MYERAETPRPWVAVADIDGRPLDAAQPNLEPTERGAIVTDVAEAVRNAALYNTVHGALSPAHIFAVPAEGGVSAVVDDWDLHQAVRSAVGELDLTPYTAPELLADPAASDERTDVYGLGAVAYYLLTGDPPVTGADLSAAIRDGDVTPPSEVTETLSKAVDEALLKALATTPADRHESAYAFKRAFTSAYDPDVADDDETVTAGAAAADTEDDETTTDDDDNSSTSATRRTALGALGVGVVGLGGGWLATQMGDDDESASAPSTSGPTETQTAEPTEEPGPVVPSISTFSLSNTSGQQLWTSFDSDEEVATVQVSITGPESTVLTTGDFSESVSNGTYTYGATYNASADGDYTATLDEAIDGGGNDGATGTSDTVTVTTTDETVAQNQLISRWPLENNLDDVVGDNDASAEYGDTTFDSYAGRRALRFDGDLGVMINRGENSELSIMDPDNAGASVGGWIYFDAVLGGNPNEDNTRRHILRNNAEYNFVADPSDDLTSFQFQFASMSESADGEMTVPSEECHHFFYTIEPGSSAQFYLDGELVHETEIALDNSTETAYWSHETIGSWYGTGDPTW